MNAKQGRQDFTIEILHDEFVRESSGTNEWVQLHVDEPSKSRFGDHENIPGWSAIRKLSSTAELAGEM